MKLHYLRHDDVEAALELSAREGWNQTAADWSRLGLRILLRYREHPMSVIVRRIEACDETKWRELWDGYVRFYEKEPSEAVTRHT